MNDRIYELIRLSTVPANQAEDYALAKGLIEPTEKLDVAKFAELIVKECANEILKWKSEPFPYDPEFGAKLIKEHFGVKE